MTEIVKKVKLNLLQHYYKYYSTIIFNLSKHIEFIYSNFLLDFPVKQNLINKLNEINKNINKIYNDYIIEKLDQFNEINKWISASKNTDLNEISSFSDFLNIQSQPLSEVK